MPRRRGVQWRKPVVLHRLAVIFEPPSENHPQAKPTRSLWFPRSRRTVAVESLFTPLRDEMDAGEKDLVRISAGKLVPAVGDVAESPDPPQVAFDRISSAVGGAVQRPVVAPIRLPQDDRLPAQVGGKGARLVVLLGAVFDQLQLTANGTEFLQWPAIPA